MKIYITVILLIVANFEWIFILANFDNIKILKNISTEQVDIKLQEKYILKLDDITMISTGVVNNQENSKKPLKNGNLPQYITIPSININSPIHTVSEDYDSYLDKGVINIVERGRKGMYLFGHSSAINKSPYQFIFTKITKLGIGNKIYIKGENGYIEEYEYKDAFYKKPEKLNELEDQEDSLYLITCYPFGSNYTRYVVHLIKTNKKYRE